MGFDSIAAQVIIVGSLLYFSSIMMGTYTESMQNMHDTVVTIQQNMDEKLNEDITIDSIVYDGATNITTVVVKNSGKKRISIDVVDVYLDEIRIPRNDTNRTIQIDPSSEIKNPDLWDPEELVEIQIEKFLLNGQHFVEIFSGNGNYAVLTYDVNE